MGAVPFASTASESGSGLVPLSSPRPRGIIQVGRPGCGRGQPIPTTHECPTTINVRTSLRIPGSWDNPCVYSRQLTKQIFPLASTTSQNTGWNQAHLCARLASVRL